MRIISFMVLLLLSKFSFGQLLQERKRTLPDGSILVYQMVSNKLSGFYNVKFGEVELERGNYLNGKRVGNWYFFNYDKSLFLRYNYDLNKMLFVDEKMLSYATINVSGENSNQASIPILLASFQQYAKIFSELAIAAIKNVHGTNLNKLNVALVAKISKDGDAKYSVTYTLKDKKYDIPVIFGSDYIVNWIPASYQGENFSSEFKIDSELSFEVGKGLHRRFNWL